MKEIEALIQPVLQQHDVTLYEIKWRKDNQMKILSIAIMFEDGSMDIDTCSTVSEAISQQLDDHPALDFEYYLEVCSPGAERVLRTLSEVNSAVGQYVYIKLNQPEQGFNEIEGTLASVDQDVLTIEYRDKTRNKKAMINYKNIKLIRLAVKI